MVLAFQNKINQILVNYYYYYHNNYNKCKYPNTFFNKLYFLMVLFFLDKMAQL